jgi:hypothetical protein
MKRSFAWPEYTSSDMKEEKIVKFILSKVSISHSHTQVLLSLHLESTSIGFKNQNDISSKMQSNAENACENGIRE